MARPLVKKRRYKIVNGVVYSAPLETAPGEVVIWEVVPTGEVIPSDLAQWELSTGEIILGDPSLAEIVNTPDLYIPHVTFSNKGGSYIKNSVLLLGYISHVAFSNKGNPVVAPTVPPPGYIPHVAFSNKGNPVVAPTVPPPGYIPHVAFSNK